MIETITTIMAASVCASTEGLERVDEIRRKKGWAKKEQAWADLAHTSRATLGRFWAGIPIQTETFQAICREVGIDNWKDIVDVDEKISSDIASKRISFAIAGSIEKLDKYKLDAIVALLNKIGGDTSIEILDIDEGSVKLILGGSTEALEKIDIFFKSGNLAQALDITVEDVHFIEKDELSQLLKNNGGKYLNLKQSDLSEVDLCKVDLWGANLSKADLRGAILRGANLREADMYNANLSGANLWIAKLSRADMHEANLSGALLIRADLRGANLSRANLSRAYVRGVSRGAILRGADLSGANLSGANLRGADLSGANLSGANLRGADLGGINLSGTQFGGNLGLSMADKSNMEARGAIFLEPPNSNLPNNVNF